MSVISHDKFVRLEYRLKLENGEYIRGSAEQPEYLVFIAGYNEVLPGLERRLWGLSKDQGTVKFVVPCDEAFGTYDPEAFRCGAKNASPPTLNYRWGSRSFPKFCLFPRNIL